MQRIIKIIVGILGILGVVFLARIIGAGDEAIKAAAEQGDTSLVDPMYLVALVVLIVIVALVVLFVIRGLFVNASGLKNTLIGVGVFAAILGISYFVLATGADESFKAGLYKSGDTLISEGESKLVGGGLIAFYLLIALAAVSMVYGGVKKIISK